MDRLAALTQLWTAHLRQSPECAVRLANAILLCPDALEEAGGLYLKASMARLCELAGMSETSARTAIGIAERQGWLRRGPRPRDFRLLTPQISRQKPTNFEAFPPIGDGVSRSTVTLSQDLDPAKPPLTTIRPNTNKPAATRGISRLSPAERELVTELSRRGLLNPAAVVLNFGAERLQHAIAYCDHQSRITEVRNWPGLLRHVLETPGEIPQPPTPTTLRDSWQAFLGRPLDGSAGPKAAAG